MIPLPKIGCPFGHPWFTPVYPFECPKCREQAQDVARLNQGLLQGENRPMTTLIRDQEIEQKQAEIKRNQAKALGVSEEMLALNWRDERALERFDRLAKAFVALTVELIDLEQRLYILTEREGGMMKEFEIGIIGRQDYEEEVQA